MRSRLNRNGAALMHKYNAHCATDVTGFGILGHAKNLASNQKRLDLQFQLDTLPVLRFMLAVDASAQCLFKLAAGYSAETSGGLLVALPAAAVEPFMAELQQLDGQPAWVVGRVAEVAEAQKYSSAVLVEGCRMVEV